MSLCVLAPPGDGFRGPVPHGAQGLALCVWFKLCYNPVRKRQRVNYGYEFRGFFSGRRGGVVWCVCVWWGGGSSARDACLSLIARHAPLATFFLSAARRQTTLRRVSTSRPRTVHGARNRTGLRKQTSWRSYQRTGIIILRNRCLLAVSAGLRAHVLPHSRQPRSVRVRPKGGVEVAQVPEHRGASAHNGPTHHIRRMVRVVVHARGGDPRSHQRWPEAEHCQQPVKLERAARPAERNRAWGIAHTQRAK